MLQISLEECLETASSMWYEPSCGEKSNTSWKPGKEQVLQNEPLLKPKAHLPWQGTGQNCSSTCRYQGCIKVTHFGRYNNNNKPE